MPRRERNWDDLKDEPKSVKDVLIEMRALGEDLIDLGFAAILTDDDTIAETVVVLEERMDRLQFQGQMSLMLSGRTPDEVEDLLGLMRVVNASERVSDAADTIADIVLEGRGFPDALRAQMREDASFPALIDIGPDRAGDSLGDIRDAHKRGTDVIGIVRDGTVVRDSDDTDTVQEGDRLIVRGMAADPLPRHEDGPAETQMFRGLKYMHQVTGLAMDLAYGAAVTQDREMAQEMLELEERTLSRRNRLTDDVLRAARKVDDPLALGGVMRIGYASAAVVDAAADIADLVERGLQTHDLLAEAMSKMATVIYTVQVRTSAGTEIGEAELPADVRVRAIKRDGRWLHQPRGGSAVEKGDLLVVKGSPATRNAVQKAFR